MAIKAFAMPKHCNRSTGNDQAIDITVCVAILGEDLGEFSYPDYELPVTGLDPATVSLINAAIAAAVQADLEMHGVEFGVGDVVVVR